MDDNTSWFKSIPQYYIIIGLGATLAIGLVLNLLACILWGNWWPLITIVAYFLAPFPNLFFARCGESYLDSASRNWQDTGYFLTGFLVVSGFGVPAVLTHAEIISTNAFILSLFGGLIVYGSILLYIHFFHSKSDEDMF